jgi:2-polyprenyl-3-methyl-5-hydroxy-6-metoxy-1,4-benzoquinol methylase/glycosyltransferase involved in cell wall biosynthesis
MQTERAPAERTAVAAPAATVGVNVVGFFRAEFGHGEAARRIAAGVERAGIPLATITVRAPHHREGHAFVERRSQELYPTNLLCLNAEHVLEFAEAGGRDLLASRYTIAAWCWEGSRFPPSLHGAFRLVDEIWVASDFVRGLIAAETDKPVLRFPMPVEIPEPPALERGDVGLPEDRFVFLFIYDFFSTLARKNPIGLIDAFTRAFEPDEGPVLVLKSINGDKWPAEFERVRAAAAAHPDIHVVDGFVPVEQVKGLTALSDCYVSLHRSEGFGLTIADAMALARPAIATRYSGNLTFMNDENSYLVDAGIATVESGIPNYPAGSVWADPDLDQAAALLRRVVDRPDEARARGEAGRRTIAEQHSLDRMGEFAAERLTEVAGLETTRGTGDTPAQLADRFLIQGPSVPWDVPSARLGPAGVWARTFLRRFLRPYLLRQREWESAVVDALRQSETIADQQARHLAAVTAELEETKERFSELSNRYVQLESELYARPYAAGAGAVAASENDYRSFEDVFRGPEERIRELLRPYVELLRGHQPVLDVGCGRGELLDLLRDHGIDARGVDVDAGMVERAREKGHDVELADAVGYLEQHHERFGAVAAIHVIEHLPYEALLRFLSLAHERLAPGGILVAETVNPHSLQAFKTFYTDLTHRAPIFPEVIVALAQIQGFADARAIFPRGTGDDDADRRAETEYALLASA